MVMAKYGLRWNLVINKISFLIIFLLYYCVSTAITVNAKEAETTSVNEIVVVLDCSKSMENVDAGYASYDFVRSLSAVLPREFRIGVVAYREDVCVSQPLGSSHVMIESALEEIKYTNYGNAGAGLLSAVELFDDEAATKRIILISDGEMMMKTEEETLESANLFAQTIEGAKNKDIIIDVIALGEKIEDGYTVYSAAEVTGGRLYEVATGEEIKDLTEELLFEQWKLNTMHVGQINGLNGKLLLELPDCLMSKAKVILLGSQQNENMTLNCEADRINVSKGKNYTVIELLNPLSDEVKIHMSSDNPMNVNAYLTAEYDLDLRADYTYVQEEQRADFRLEVVNQNGQDLVQGHLKDGNVQVYLDGEEQTYQIIDGNLCISKQYEQDAMVDLRIAFDGLYGNYYGDTEEIVEIVVPIIEEEPPKIDWFFG